MSTQGWTPVDESASAWKPVNDSPGLSAAARQISPLALRQFSGQTSPDEQGEETTPEDRARNAAWDKLPRGTKFKLSLMPGAMDEWSKQFYGGQLDPHGDTAALGKVLEPTLGQMAEGTGDVLEGDIAKGGHKIIKSGSLMALPLMTKGALAAPLAAVRAVAGGYVGGKVAEGGTAALGGNEDQKAFAEDIGNVIGAGAGANAPKALPLLSRTAGKLTDIIPEHVTNWVKENPQAAKAMLALLEPRKTAVNLIKGAVDEGLTAAQVPAKADAESAAGAISGEPEPSPAPYRLSGNQIQDATTVTPRRVLGPDRQLNAAPEEVPAAQPAQPPKTSQVLKDAGVTQAMKEAGVAAPSASIRAVRPGTTPQLAPRADLSFPPGLTGEDAALMQLTRQNINELRFIAQKRGLPVSPKDTHAELIGKIHESLKPEEVQGFQAAAQQSKAVPSQFPENNLIADGLNKEAAELQAGKGDPYRIATLRNAAATVRQYPQGMAQVDFAATKIRGIDKGIRQRIGDMLTEQKAVPGGDDTVQTTAGQPMTILEAMRRSLQARGIKPPY